MIFTTSEVVPGREIKEILGIVTGNVVQSKHIGRDIMASIKSILGGELKGYTELLSQARDTAIKRIVAEAANLNADAIINIRFTTSAVMDGASEIMVYGTAVKLS